MIPAQSADTIRRHMAVINSYYSNLIEGNRTLPHEIRQAIKPRWHKQTIRLKVPVMVVAP